MTARGRLTWSPAITRAQVKAQRDTLFVFGDNMVGRGYGGQAREMRGEPNALGVPTKWEPSYKPGAYFKDRDLDEPRVLGAIEDAFTRIEDALRAGRDVVLPQAGLGTGRAELQQQAPRIASFIQAHIARLEYIARVVEG